MSSWDDLYDLIRQAERALLRLKADQGAPQWEVLKQAEAGWYTRGYLAERLPAEIARSRRSGRPFGLGMLRVAAREELAPANWRSFLLQYLDPIEVAFAYGERDLCFLFPELDGAKARSRMLELCGTAVLAGLVSGRSLLVSSLSYPEVQAAPDALLLQLEEGLLPYAAREGGEPTSGRASEPVYVPDGDPVGRQAGVEGAAGNEAARNEAAVGFSSERQFPVSVWYRGEFYTIQAVLDDERAPGGVRRMLVVTENGLFRLEQEGDHWYAQKLKS